MRRFRALCVAVAALALVAAPRPAWAWDELGHKVVARIAWDNMTPQARANAIALLRAAPADAGIRELMPADGRPLAERERDWFVETAVWADLVRSRSHMGYRYAQSTWHYVNFFWEQRDGRAIDRPDVPRAGDLLTRLSSYGTTLSPSPATPQAALDLAWTLHLVGDGHQPLHNSARITAQDTAGDRGGNSFRIKGRSDNLHSFWDGLVGPAFPWVRGDSTESAYVGRIAAELQRRQPRVAGRILPGQFERWSAEGLTTAQRVIYPADLIRDEVPPASYRARAWRAAEPRLAMAGYRLADLLNARLGA